MTYPLPRLYESAFVMGVFNGTAELRDPLIIDRNEHGVDCALSLVAEQLLINELETGLKVAFRIKPDQICGESRAVRATLAHFEHTLGILEPSGSKNLQFVRGGENTAQDFHIRFRIPGKLALYEELGKEFVELLES